MLNFTTISAIIYEPLLAFRALLFIFHSALAKTYLLTSFGSGGGLFERLGNVYGFSVGIYVSNF